MRIKKFKEKLTLNKKTIANLNRSGMQKIINGGTSGPPGDTYNPGCNSDFFCGPGGGMSGARPDAASICPGCK